MLTPLLNSLLFFPARRLTATPTQAGIDHEDVTIATADGKRLYGWWVRAHPSPPTAHVLLCHGNAGNIGDRVPHAAALCAAGLDVLLFDYRGYGRSTGRPSELGTYQDARAALAALLARPEVDPDRIVYLGESLGGAVALELALERPPAGLVLMSTFTSVRDLAKRHYPFIPQALVPDAYPSLRRLREVRAHVLVIHGECDTIVPLLHAQELYAAAPGPKQLQVIDDVGHNDVIAHAGEVWTAAIARFCAGLT